MEGIQYVIGCLHSLIGADVDIKELITTAGDLQFTNKREREEFIAKATKLILK